MDTAKDIARRYMIELGLKPADSPKKFISRMESAIGILRTDRLIRALNARAQAQMRGESADDAAFYAMKNTDYMTSIAMSGASDGDTLGKLCTWIYDNREKFGSDILEIGCDNGILSCFMARLFPEANITAIDRCAPAIEVAKKLAERLNIRNVEFLHGEAASLPPRRFDTVFSSRIMHENHRLINSPPAEGLDCQAQLFKRSALDYAALLASLAKENAVILSVERMGKTSLLLGWLYALNAAGLIPEAGSYRELSCMEMGSPAHFQALTARPGTPLDEAALKALFDIEFEDKINLAEQAWKSWICEQ